jgi:hypothetical protein
MSDRRVSRGTIVEPVEAILVPRNLLQVRDKLKTLVLPERQRADLISALNSIGHLHKRPGEQQLEPALANLDAAPWRILPHLRSFAYARHGMKKASWNNIVSRVRKALQVTGARVRDGRRQTHLTSDWAAIFDPLPLKPFKASLGGFVSWCSEGHPSKRRDPGGV